METTIAPTVGSIYKQTQNLRLFAELVQMRPRLQQYWQSVTTADGYWQDVPIVFGESKNPTMSFEP